MATTVTYKGQTLTTVDNTTKTLETAGTWMEDDLTLTDVSGGGGGNILEMNNVNGSLIKWISPALPKTLADGGVLEVTVDVSNVSANKYENVVSVGNHTTVTSWRNTASSHVYFYSSTDSFEVSQNGTAVSSAAVDKTIPHTIKVDKDYFYIDGVQLVAVQSGVSTLSEVLIGGAEGNVRFDGEYISIRYK